MNDVKETQVATINTANIVANTNFAECEEGQGARIRETSTTNEKTLYNAITGSGENPKDYLGVEMQIVDIVVTSADVEKEKGKPENGKVNKPCIHFFTADGLHLSSISNGIARSVKALFEFGMLPTAEKPMSIIFKTVETKKGTAYTFELT